MWVYPRVCGGTIDDMVARQAQQGLSPRVRGNRFILFVAAIVDRSIPACAGEPGSPQQLECSVQVYPRVCGGMAYRSVVHAVTPSTDSRASRNFK